MLRGELSNRPAAICCVDYRILLDVKEHYAWFKCAVPRLLLETGFERKMKNLLPLKDGALQWLEANWETRFVGLSVGVPFLSRTIDMVLSDYVADTFHFDTKEEFRIFLRRKNMVYKVYTNDPVLLGVDEIFQPHSGWTERA